MERDARAFAPIFYVVGTVGDHKVTLTLFDVEFPTAKHYG